MSKKTMTTATMMMMTTKIIQYIEQNVREKQHGKE